MTDPKKRASRCYLCSHKKKEDGTEEVIAMHSYFQPMVEYLFDPDIKR